MEIGNLRIVLESGPPWTSHFSGGENLNNSCSSSILPAFRIKRANVCEGKRWKKTNAY